MEPRSVRRHSLVLATVFDSGYAARGLTMIESAGLSSSAFVRVLGLDEESKAVGQIVRNISFQSLPELIANQPLLRGALMGKTKAEVIFTVNPTFLQTLIGEVELDGWLVYADADLFFKVPLENYLRDFKHANVILASHRHYPWNRKRLAKFGEFNVGLVAFRNNDEGRRALSFWAESCINWCFDYPLEGKYADQKYLEDFSRVSKGVIVDVRSGANQAPWNAPLPKILNLFFRAGVNSEILYFHMQGLRRLRKYWQLGHLPYFALATKNLIRDVYTPYLARLELAQKRLGFSSSQSGARWPTGFWLGLVDALMRIVAIFFGQTISVKKLRTEIEENSTQ